MKHKNLLHRIKNKRFSVPVTITIVGISAILLYNYQYREIPSQQQKSTPSIVIHNTAEQIQEVSPAPTNTVSNPTIKISPTINLNSNSSVKLISINPSSATSQQIISLMGSGFGNSQGYVIFYNSQGVASGSPVPQSWSDTEVKTGVYFVNRGNYYVSIRTSDGKESNKISLTVTAGQPYIGAINGSEYAPYSAKRNTSVALKGGEFGTSGRVELKSAGNTYTLPINSWSNSDIVFTLQPELINTEYEISVVRSDNVGSSIKYLDITD